MMQNKSLAQRKKYNGINNLKKKNKILHDLKKYVMEMIFCES